MTHMSCLAEGVAEEGRREGRVRAWVEELQLDGLVYEDGEGRLQVL